MLYKLGGHADPVIFDNKTVIPVSVAERRLLDDPERDRSSGRRVFDRIAHQVDEDLVQLQGIRYHIFIVDLKRINEQFQLLRLHLRLYDVDKIVHQFRDIALLFLDLYLPAFDPAHIQNIVDQA